MIYPDHICVYYTACERIPKFSWNGQHLMKIIHSDAIIQIVPNLLLEIFGWSVIKWSCTWLRTAPKCIIGHFGFSALCVFCFHPCFVCVSFPSNNSLKQNLINTFITVYGDTSKQCGDSYGRQRLVCIFGTIPNTILQSLLFFSLFVHLIFFLLLSQI